MNGSVENERDNLSTFGEKRFLTLCPCSPSLKRLPSLLGYPRLRFLSLGKEGTCFRASVLRSLDLLVFSRNGISFLRFLFVSPSSRQLCHTSLASLAWSCHPRENAVQHKDAIAKLFKVSLIPVSHLVRSREKELMRPSTPRELDFPLSEPFSDPQSSGTCSKKPKERSQTRFGFASCSIQSPLPRAPQINCPSFPSTLNSVNLQANRIHFRLESEP